MHRIFRHMLMILSLSLMLPCCASAQSGTQTLEMFTVNVGKGDAIIIRIDDYACLVDAGKAYARGKILAAMEYMGIDAFDDVFLTHTDDDHAEGLEWLAQSDIPVGRWFASAMYTGVKEKKHPAVKAAEERNTSVIWLERGAVIPIGNTSATLSVLSPEVLNTDKDDNNSLVMMLESDAGKILLAGDMELIQEAQLLHSGDILTCDILKVPNHADDDTTSDAFAKAASPKLAVISTSTAEKPETPDPGVINRLKAAGAECAVTQDGELGIFATLTDGNAAWEYVNIHAGKESISLREVVAGDDIIVLHNENAVAVNLSGWYLFSDKGEEMYVFPSGTAMDANSRLIIGTQSSEDDDVDLVWPEKKVINKSKTDVITLYDRYGRTVDSLSNGY